jgi:hypothetical protein
MKKKISGKLTLGKRSVATLSAESMSQVNGGYSEGCGSGGGSGGCSGTCTCPPAPTSGCVSGICSGSGSGTYVAYTQPRYC